MRLHDFIVAGEIYLDLTMAGFKTWPKPGMESFAEEFFREIGGGTSITACGLAKLGSRTAVLGLVGSEWGQWVVARMKESGVDTAGVGCVLEEPTGFTVVATTPEDRAFLSYGGANRKLPALLEEAMRTNQFIGARHVHLACAPPLASAGELIAAIHRDGCTVSVDVGWHEEWLSDPRAKALLPEIDWFFPNEVEARFMTGEAEPDQALAWFRKAGARGVALKLGPAGAALLEDGRVYRVDRHPVTPRDTTGAGDSFDAGFLHYWIEGEVPEACLRAGNICGAVSTEGYGAIGAFPTLERLKKEMKRGA